MPDWRVRGVRGATTVSANSRDEILEATAELLREMQRRNGFDPCDIASVFFTVTTDLDAVFPPRAARDLGWVNVPMIGSNEIPVPGSLPKCIRVLVHLNTTMSQDEVKHVYLRGARVLRPDLAAGDLE